MARHVHAAVHLCQSRSKCIHLSSAKALFKTLIRPALLLHAESWPDLESNHDHVLRCASIFCVPVHPVGFHRDGRGAYCKGNIAESFTFLTPPTSLHLRHDELAGSSLHVCRLTW